jgi:hypothetical protein
MKIKRMVYINAVIQSGFHVPCATAFFSGFSAHTVRSCHTPHLWTPCIQYSGHSYIRFVEVRSSYDPTIMRASIHTPIHNNTHRNYSMTPYLWTDDPLQWFIYYIRLINIIYYIWNKNYYPVSLFVSFLLLLLLLLVYYTAVCVVILGLRLGRLPRTRWLWRYICVYIYIYPSPCRACMLHVE